ncbi:lysine ketoglutarate reductase trans-splicing protein (DUF707) [Rhynchospora pubera]|uniref:Lysine ketoglutarate reductase trans-splicing protein (DUF707) n=1 Tax=Rhynchospora pubera TaxID=906938 RepID=A0AAV8FYF8_9POAL|nr:lysine ketoglutarate reductase trans-splicing protein (DUF707) [Rhynchospora pubera]KAJ4798343.1 lysine ketoglutarate reductase trans-splicing protein (DUF707) [Rhynchospora pubera]KAJ4809945.1 lysine ketoglutarate reductase trans-splicing protein (DUF707) [Rhynchospora pubera]
MAKTPRHSGVYRRSNENMRLVITTVIGAVIGFCIGISFPSVSITKLHFPTSIISYVEDKSSGISTQALLNHAWTSAKNIRDNDTHLNSNNSKIYVPTNPKGAERLAPGIVVQESDLYLRRLWGDPSEDLKTKQKYLVTFTVGYDQRHNIDKAVKKFSDDFLIVLFHYDGRTSEWDEFEWSKKAIHISGRKQTKWWFAKRFLHPDIVAPFEYIFIWDEDLGVEHFNAEKYIKLVKKHGLEISQPGLEPNQGLTWQMTKRRGDTEVHKDTIERPGWCSDGPLLPPCAAFVEIMAPVFSKDSWRCVWHMIQNDLVHGWGLDFALRRCVEPAHEKIGVVDSQWIVHQSVPSLGNQGKSENGKAPWEGVRERCRKEWATFKTRWSEAERSYYKLMGIVLPNNTVV